MQHIFFETQNYEKLLNNLFIPQKMEFSGNFLTIFQAFGDYKKYNKQSAIATKYFLFAFVLNCCYTKYEKRHFAKHNEPEAPIKNPRDLVSEPQLVALFNKCNLKEKVWLAILTLSGRRQGDVAKITQSGVNSEGDRTFILLPKDKSHQNSLVSFQVCWRWQLDIDLAPLKEEFKRLLQAEPFPFKEINVQAVRRKCNFKLHAIRNYSAILLAIRGYSKEAIMNKIGWASEQSLLRYIRVPVEILSQFSNYEEAFKFLT